MATKNQIAPAVWIMEIILRPWVKSHKQICLRFIFQERVGMIHLFSGNLSHPLNPLKRQSLAFWVTCQKYRSKVRKIDLVKHTFSVLHKVFFSYTFSLWPCDFCLFHFVEGADFPRENFVKIWVFSNFQSNPFQFISNNPALFP